MGGVVKSISKPFKSVAKGISKVVKKTAQAIKKVGKSVMKGVAKISNKLGPVRYDCFIYSYAICFSRIK
jgi:uncharacterized lipoprotein YddW (UPF0748 family)